MELNPMSDARWLPNGQVGQYLGRGHYVMTKAVHYIERRESTEIQLQSLSPTLQARMDDNGFCWSYLDLNYLGNLSSIQG